MRGRTPADPGRFYNISIETGDAAMTATRTTSLIAQTLIAAAFAVVMFGGAFQAVASKASAGSYTAPTYGSAMLDMGDAE